MSNEPNQSRGATTLPSCHDGKLRDPTKHTKVIALFDSGSQVSFISQHLANVFELCSREAIDNSVGTCGQQWPSQHQWDKVQTVLKLSNGEDYNMLLNTVKFLTRNIQVTGDKFSKRIACGFCAEKKEKWVCKESFVSINNQWNQPDLLIELIVILI